MWKTRQNHKELNCREKRPKSSQKWTVMALKLCRKCEDLLDRNVSKQPKNHVSMSFSSMLSSPLTTYARSTPSLLIAVATFSVSDGL